jgi:hypothetical protein
MKGSLKINIFFIFGHHKCRENKIFDETDKTENKKHMNTTYQNVTKPNIT